VAGIAWDSGRFFIARRAGGGDMGGKWEFPGGKVDEGESDEAALTREYAEEFGVDITLGAFLGSAAFEHRGIPYRVNAYRIFLPHTKLSLSEHTQWRWAALEEIEGLDFVDSDLKLVPALKKSGLS
jgi:8-oxo-dGTP diphosphatase